MSRRRRRRSRPWLSDMMLMGYGRAWDSPIEELSYELLKDPEYQEFLDEVLARLAEITFRKLGKRRKNARPA